MTALPQTTAHLLATARYPAVFNTVLFAAALWQGGWLFILHGILSAILLYLHIRIDFDRRLFTDFAGDRLRPSDFDRCRAELGLGHANSERSLQQRCTGALKLWRTLIYLSGIQLAVTTVQLVCF